MKKQTNCSQTQNSHMPSIKLPLMLSSTTTVYCQAQEIDGTTVLSHIQSLFLLQQFLQALCTVQFCEILSLNSLSNHQHRLQNQKGIWSLCCIRITKESGFHHEKFPRVNNHTVSAALILAIMNVKLLKSRDKLNNQGHSLKCLCEVSLKFTGLMYPHMVLYIINHMCFICIMQLNIVVNREQTLLIQHLLLYQAHLPCV